MNATPDPGSYAALGQGAQPASPDDAYASRLLQSLRASASPLLVDRTPYPNYAGTTLVVAGKKLGDGYVSIVWLHGDHIPDDIRAAFLKINVSNDRPTLQKPDHSLGSWVLGSVYEARITGSDQALAASIVEPVNRNPRQRAAEITGVE